METLPVLPLEQVTQVAQTIQLALAPVFLLAGIGAFLNVCTGRLARVIDRARVVESLVLETRGEEHDRLVDEIRKLDQRMSVVNTAIFLGAASGGSVCLVVILLFASELFNAAMGTPIALLFVLSMVLLLGGFGTFIQEIRLAFRSLNVRQEVLHHTVDDSALM